MQKGSKYHCKLRHLMKENADIFVTPPPKVRLPVVEIDGNTLYIKSLQSGSNITVTLEDMDGNTIYNVASIAEANMSFLVTQNILDYAHAIIINIDGKEYFGEI